MREQSQSSPSYFLHRLPIYNLIGRQRLQRPFSQPPPYPIHNRIQPRPSRHDPIQIMYRNPAPMIRNPLLPPIISPNLIAPPHPRNPNNTNPQPRHLLLPLLPPRLRQPRPQQRPSLLPIPHLAPRILNRHHRPRRQMRQPHRRIRRIDMLAPSAPSAHHIRPHVFHIDVVITLRIIPPTFPQILPPLCGKTRQHEHAHRARVRPSFRLGRRHALHPVDARLAPEQPVRPFGLDLEHGFRDQVFRAYSFGFFDLQECGAQ